MPTYARGHISVSVGKVGARKAILPFQAFFGILIVLAGGFYITATPHAYNLSTPRFQQLIEVKTTSPDSKAHIQISEQGNNPAKPIRDDHPSVRIADTRHV